MLHYRPSSVSGLFRLKTTPRIRPPTLNQQRDPGFRPLRRSLVTVGNQAPTVSITTWQCFRWGFAGATLGVFGSVFLLKWTLGRHVQADFSRFHASERRKVVDHLAKLQDSELKMSLKEWLPIFSEVHRSMWFDIVIGALGLNNWTLQQSSLVSEYMIMFRHHCIEYVNKTGIGMDAPFHLQGPREELVAILTAPKAVRTGIITLPFGSKVEFYNFSRNHS